MSPISTRLAVICLTFPMAAALSAHSPAGIARKPQEQRDKAKTTPTKTHTKQTDTGKQFITLFDVGAVGNSGGPVPQLVTISGRGYAGTPDDRRRAGKKSEPDEDERVAVIIRDARDPVLPSCWNLLVAEVFMEHAVQISGIGHVVRHHPDAGPRPVTLRLDRLSKCTAVPLR